MAFKRLDRWTILVIFALGCWSYLLSTYTIDIKVTMPDTRSNSVYMENSNSVSLGICTDPVFNVMFELKVSPDEGHTVTGRYINDKNGSRILLVSTDVSTIAHEVSHFVDDVMQSRSIKDDETRAYLQGHYTKCAYRKVQHHKSTETECTVDDKGDCWFAIPYFEDY